MVWSRRRPAPPCKGETVMEWHRATIQFRISTTPVRLCRRAVEVRRDKDRYVQRRHRSLPNLFYSLRSTSLSTLYFLVAHPPAVFARNEEERSARVLLYRTGGTKQSKIRPRCCSGAGCSLESPVTIPWTVWSLLWSLLTATCGRVRMSRL